MRKWGIGLEKEEETLSKTTKDYISSSLLPLTRRYCTALISKLLRSLSYTLYTDMLFANQKFIIGDTCAKILTDVEGLVYVHSMQSK